MKEKNIHLLRTRHPKCTNYYGALHTHISEDEN